jgi:hypothetical protein
MDDDTDLRFVLVANTKHKELLKTQEYLQGKAYIIDRKGWPSANRLTSTYIDQLNNYRTILLNGNHESLEAFACEKQATLFSDLDKWAVFNVSVRISRTGTTDIKFDEASLLYPASPHLGQPLLIKKLASQIFFFLKDVGHHHQHHDNRTDTIVDLQPATGPINQDIKWRVDTLYNIYRRVIYYKRQSDRATFNDCLGLIAYSQAFRKISEEELEKELIKQLPAYYSEQVIQSIEATQSKIERSLDEERNHADKVSNILLASVGLIIGYVGLMQFTGPRTEKYAPILDRILKFLLQHPIYSVTIYLVLLILAPWIWTKRKIFGVSDNFFRLFSWMRKTKLLLLLFSIGLFLWASIFLIYYF